VRVGTVHGSCTFKYMRQQVRTEQEINYKTCCPFFYGFKVQERLMRFGNFVSQAGGKKAWGELFKIIKSMLGKGYNCAVDKKC